MRHSRWIGIAATLLLVAACFMPWAYFPDLQKSFTGFYSEHNAYGRPGKIFIFLAVIAAILYFIPRVWAVRFNMIVGAIILAFGIKCWILYNACYRGLCPEKKIGIILILVAPVIMILAAILPDIKLKEKKD